MPTLPNPRYEAFAQARAKGALMTDAYESAGFVRHRGRPSRLAVRPEVAERIAELRASQRDAEDTSPGALLAALGRIIKAGESSENPTLVNAARLAVLDASRLRAELAKAQAAEHVYIDNAYKNLKAGVYGDEPPEGWADSPETPTSATLALPAGSPSAPPQLPSGAPGAPSGLPASAPKAPRALPRLSGAA